MAEPVADATMFDAALKVLAERGYAGATTRRIADAAGVNEVTLFRRFGDKRQLILAAIGADIDRFANDGLTATGNLEADLIRVVEYYSDIYQHRDGLVGTLLLEGARSPDVAALIQGPLGAMSRLGEILAGYRARRTDDRRAHGVRSSGTPCTSPRDDAFGARHRYRSCSPRCQHCGSAILGRSPPGGSGCLGNAVAFDLAELSDFGPRPEGSPELMFLGTATTWHRHLVGGCPMQCTCTMP